MDNAVTITLQPQKKRYPVSVGDKIKLKNGSGLEKLSSIKNQQFIYRLKRKAGEFVPYFIVTFVDNTPPNFNFHLKPYNF